MLNTIAELHSRILMQLLIISSLKSVESIVKQVSRYVSYREVSISLQPYLPHFRSYQLLLITSEQFQFLAESTAAKLSYQHAENRDIYPHRSNSLLLSEIPTNFQTSNGRAQPVELDLFYKLYSTKAGVKTQRQSKNMQYVYKFENITFVTRIPG